MPEHAPAYRSRPRQRQPLIIDGEAIPIKGTAHRQTTHSGLLPRTTRAIRGRACASLLGLLAGITLLMLVFPPGFPGSGRHAGQSHVEQAASAAEEAFFIR